MQREAKVTATTRINPSVYAEVRRLLAAEPRGLSAGGMARIARMSLEDVEEVLAAMEKAGDAAPTVTVFRGSPFVSWRRK